MRQVLRGFLLASAKESLVMNPIDHIPLQGYSAKTTCLKAALSLEKRNPTICFAEGYIWRTPGRPMKQFSKEDNARLPRKWVAAKPVSQTINIPRIIPTPGMKKPQLLLK